MLDLVFLAGVLLLMTGPLIRRAHWRRPVLWAGFILLFIAFAITTAVLGPDLLRALRAATH